jgi:7-cyano-7-deazaguanine reductase
MNERDTPLGRVVGYDANYDPGLLFPIPRQDGRQRLGLDNARLPFTGVDVWNAYELSWLDPAGKPQVAWGEFRFAATTPAIVESKSFKLYLNSLNQHCFADVTAVADTLRCDLSSCVGDGVEVELHLPTSWEQFPPQPPDGQCLDDLPVNIDRYEPAPEFLRITSAGKIVSRKLFSRLLRSRCPVTGQPDWGTVQIAYSGAEIDESGLLAYIVSFRQHQDFHEHCVERMFVDIQARCAPQQLSVYARYLRRGGLDINPYRSTDPRPPANSRWFQQ